MERYVPASSEFCGNKAQAHGPDRFFLVLKGIAESMLHLQRLEVNNWY